MGSTRLRTGVAMLLRWRWPRTAGRGRLRRLSRAQRNLLLFSVLACAQRSGCASSRHADSRSAARALRLLRLARAGAGAAAGSAAGGSPAARRAARDLESHPGSGLEPEWPVLRLARDSLRAAA